MLRNSLSSGLRCLARRATGFSSGDTAKRGNGALRKLSSLEESVVQITFVDVNGQRATVPAFEGQNLVAIAKKHNIALEGPCEGLGSPVQRRNSETWTEDLFGEGPKCTCCHVMIPNEYVDQLEPPFNGEIALMERLGDLYAPGTSRLACQIPVSKELDGLTVFIPDGPPLDGS